MALLGSRVTATTTAGIVVPGGGTINDPVPAIITNQDASVSAYLGGAGVTSAAGYELKAGASITVSIIPTDVLYAVTASGTVRLDVLAGRQ